MRHSPLFLLAFCVACAGTHDGRALSIETAIRSSYAQQLQVLGHDQTTAIARTETEVMAYALGSHGVWVCISSIALPADWSQEASSGFRTYVDEARLLTSYQSFLDAVREPASPGLSLPISQTSPLASVARNRIALDFSSPATSGTSRPRLVAHCAGSQGRYAYALIDSQAIDGVAHDWCLQAVIGSQRLVVFRADDGAAWLTYDERGCKPVPVE